MHDRAMPVRCRISPLLVPGVDRAVCGYYNLPKSQTNRLQVIQNSLARAVVKAPKFCYLTPILKSLNWLKINERIKYKLLSLTYKTLITAQPTYLHRLISVQPIVLLAPHLLSPSLHRLHLLL